MTPAADLAERVALGAAWLDANLPLWRRDVKAGRLDLGDSCDCVLGQTLQADDPDEFYFAVAVHTDGSGAEAYPGERWAIAHGFDSGWGITPGGNRALRAEWLRQLQPVPV